MEIKYGDGLEFEPAVDFSDAQLPPRLAANPATSAPSSLPVTDREEALRQILRHRFREPVRAEDGVSLAVGDVSYVVFNLSLQGVGIYLTSRDNWQEQTRLRAMTLSLGGQSFLVEGTVVHLSPDGLQYLCGIALTSVTPPCQEAITSYLQRREALPAV